MNDNKINNAIDEHSFEVREILGQTPNWMIRWGTSTIFMIVFIFLIGAWRIQYNDIIPAEVIVTSKNPPIYLKANVSGRLTKIFVKPNDSVNKGDFLAVIENSSKYEDVIYLSKALENFIPEMYSLDTLKEKFPSNLSLGSLQYFYGEFLTQYQNLILFDLLSVNTKESLTLKEQLNAQNNFLDEQKKQLKIFLEELNLSKNAFERNKILYEKGVISKSEFENATRLYLIDQKRHKELLQSISNSKIAISNFNNLIVKSDLQATELGEKYVQELEKAYQNLKSELMEWHQQYLIKSPISGRVTVFDVWNLYQNVEVGDVLFTVVPNNLDNIIGKVSLPIRNSGKVKKGQRAILKLDNYPFEEWGSLEGKISHISEVPTQEKEGFYKLYIEIDSLNTSFGKKIKFKQEMRGTCEIIVEELSILQRIFYQLRGAFN